MYKEITPIEFKEKYLKELNKLEIIDVRESYEFDQIKIKNSKLISLSDFEKNLDKIDWSKDVIFVCRTWSRSWYITEILSKNWFNWTNLVWWISMLRFNCEECIESWEFNKNYFE